jgi:choice-of-anchor B domain-containing protein
MAGSSTVRLCILALAFVTLAPVRGHAALSAAWQQSADSQALEVPVVGTEVKCDKNKAKIFDCQNVDLISYLPVSAIGGKTTLDLGGLPVRINDMWGWTDPKSGREFALVARVDGLAFVEVTDPIHPKYLGELPLHEGAQPSYWRDVKTYKNYAFVVSDAAGEHGVQVFDLQQLLDIKTPPITFKETAYYDRVASAHNIAIDTASGFAYPIGANSGGESCAGGLHMIDIRNPTAPVFVGCGLDTTSQETQNYIHDAQCVVYRGPDQRYTGRQICIGSGAIGVQIIDVTDKHAPKRLGVCADCGGHQAWLTDDQRFLYVDHESGGDGEHGTRTSVLDLKDLTDPVLAKDYFGPTQAVDHNLYVHGHYVYEANYKAGLRILDISDPKNPVEVGYFDTTPFAENDGQYGGAWSDYPFFKNGVVGISSISEGFFLVRFKPGAGTP